MYICYERRAKVAKIVRDRIEALRGRKSALQIAQEIGYDSDRMLYVFGSGQFRVPEDKAVELAIALEIEPGAFFQAVYESSVPLPEGIRISYDPSKVLGFEGGREDIAEDYYSEGESGNSAASVEQSIRATLVDLNFKVSPSFHRSFKLEATARGISMKDLLEDCFNAFREQQN